MKWKIPLFVFLLTTAFILDAAAHPLGNFSVNQYSRLEVERSEMKLRAVLDLAEIPTVQESASIDVDRDGRFSREELEAYAIRLTPTYAANLLITVNGEAVALTPLSHEVTLGTGAGDLSTIKISWNMIAKLPPVSEINRLRFQNLNNPERTGWNEIVVSAVPGVNIFNSTSYGNGVTEELSDYPQEAVTATLNERTAEFSFSTHPVPADAKALQNRDGHNAAPLQKDKLASLISVPEITPLVAFFGLFVAFGLGALHAMSPGHGKTVVGAYLVGSRGTAKHALFLGLTVTITHTLGVFALGLITLFASNYILPDRLMPFLGFVSGLLVFFIGATLFKDRLFTFLGRKTQNAGHHHDHDHDEDTPHTHSHDGVMHTHGGSTHSHALPDEITWRSLLALGISGGLLPCPSALVLMLSAITLGRVGYGLVLTVAFSFGLAATLTAVGLIFLNIRNIFGKTSFSESRVFRFLPVFSAFVIAFVGAMLCYNALA